MDSQQHTENSKQELIRDAEKAYYSAKWSVFLIPLSVAALVIPLMLDYSQFWLGWFLILLLATLAFACLWKSLANVKIINTARKHTGKNLLGISRNLLFATISLVTLIGSLFVLLISFLFYSGL